LHAAFAEFHSLQATERGIANPGERLGGGVYDGGADDRGRLGQRLTKPVVRERLQNGKASSHGTSRDEEAVVDSR
jgi:hypothetical protein